MKELLLLMLLSVTIILGGIWLVEQPQVRTSRDELNSTLEEVDKTVFRAVPDKPVISPPRPPTATQQALSQGNYQSAVEEFENVWNDSEEQAEIERQRILSGAKALINSGQPTEAESLLITYREAFITDPDPLVLLTEIMEQQGRIEEALNYSLELRELLLDLDKQAITDRRIVALAASFKAEMEKIDNHTEIVVLYQSLYNRYPGNQSIVFELGMAYFAVEQFGDAWGMFNQLVYEPTWQACATRMLERIQDAQNNLSSGATATPPGNVVQLTQSGDHYLVDSSINAANATLLLDTGASITALDSKFLERIGARDTGRRLTLQTANGQTEGIVYEIRLLRIGRTQVHNFEVAGLDFGERTRFDGLLGMDFLNMFSYTIDNSNNTLMLTPN